MSRRIIGVRRGNSVQERIQNPVQDIAELRLIPTTDVVDKAIIVVEDLGAIYRFDYSGAGVDDGSTIIEPTSGPGRWFFVAGGIVASGIQDLEPKRYSFPPLPKKIQIEKDIAHENMQVLAIKIYQDTTPTTSGVYTLKIRGAGNNLLSATSIDLTGEAAATIIDLPLTGTTSHLELAADDLIEIEIESDNADLVGTSLYVQMVCQGIGGSEVLGLLAGLDQPVLHEIQLATFGIQPATAFWFSPALNSTVPADGDFLVITDGTTTETYTFRAAPGSPFEVLIGADILDTMQELADQINADSVQWEAAKVDDLSRLNSTTPNRGHAVVISRTSTGGTSDDRLYGTFTTSVVPKVADYSVSSGDYGRDTTDFSSMVLNLPSGDSGQNQFGYRAQGFQDLNNGIYRGTVSGEGLFQYIRRNPTNTSGWTAVIPPGGSVSGPGSSTDTAIALWDGATGTLLQDSPVLVDPVTGDTTHPGNITMDGDKDWIPNVDGEGEIGTDAKRFKRVRAEEIVSGDLVMQAADGTAKWRFVEKPDCIFVTNELTGQRFRLALIPIEPEPTESST